MAKSQLGNETGDIEKCWIAAKASMNGVAVTKNNNIVKLMDCGIDTMKISTLGDYLFDKRVKEGKEINFDLKDDKKLAQKYVIPVILPNGEEIEVIVNKNGQDEACIYKDAEGRQGEFRLTPRMEREIERNSPENLKTVIGEKAYREGLFPDTLDEYADKVQKDELVPKSEKHAAKIVGIGSEELIKEQEERENAKKEIPAELRDSISKVCRENNLDIKDLKQVMEVEPEVIQKGLDNTGIRENDGRVQCLRFKDAAKLQGRVVMVQGTRAVDDRKNDEFLNDYMNEHMNQKYVKETECEHDKLVYKDVHGNTTVCEMTKEPRDLKCTDKEELQEEMRKLDENAEYILNSDMTLEQKTEQIIKINGKRLDLFKEYGITAPTVENEITADIQLSEDVGEREESKRLDEEELQEEITDETLELPTEEPEEVIEEESEETGIEGYESHYGRAETGDGFERYR